MTVNDDIRKARELIKTLNESGELSDKTSYLIGILTDILDSLSDSINDLQTQIHDSAEFIDEVDSDLSDLEDYVYGDEAIPDNEDFSFEYNVECPSCGGKMFITEEDDIEEVVCPKCGRHFSAVDQIDLDELEDDDTDDLGDMSPGDDDEETPDENTIWL